MINTLKIWIPRPIRNILGQLVSLKREITPYLIWNWRLRNDEMFKIVNIDKGLENRVTSSTRTPAQRLEVAQRIIDAYQLANEEQASKSEVYRVSNEWIPIFRKPLQPLLNVLEKRDAVGLRDLLDNFFRSPISVGLIGLPVDMSTTFFGMTRPSRFRKKQLMIDQLYRFRLLQRLIPNIHPSDLHLEDFGNPYGMYVNDTFIRTGADYQYYYANQVNHLLGEFDLPTVVVELGGGIGGFAAFLQKARPSNLTYINLDLPEILCISAYQLLNLFPEKKSVLYGEINDLSTKALSAYDLALLPCFAIESLNTDTVDVAFNSYSLAEMDSPTIENYAKQFSRICRGNILHVNHVRNSLVSANDFPFDNTKFTLKNRIRAEWNIGRDLSCDEYEFIYENINNTINSKN